MAWIQLLVATVCGSSAGTTFWEQPHTPFGGTAGVFGTANATESTSFFHELPAGVEQGAINHWFCVPFDTTAGVVHRFYIDGEANASVVYEPHQVSATWPGKNGTNESPWGIQYFGKGSHEVNVGSDSRDAYYSNIRIPFGKSVRLTISSRTRQAYALHIRGAENMAVTVGDLPPLPLGARLKTITTTAARQPAEYHPVVQRSGVHGLLFGWLLQVSSHK
jgi:hypothetical protein